MKSHHGKKKTITTNYSKKISQKMHSSLTTNDHIQLFERLIIKQMPIDTIFTKAHCRRPLLQISWILHDNQSSRFLLHYTTTGK